MKVVPREAVPDIDALMHEVDILRNLHHYQVIRYVIYFLGKGVPLVDPAPQFRKFQSKRAGQEPGPANHENQNHRDSLPSMSPGGCTENVR